MSHKLHNPKSHAPAVYIPCWLIQVPVKVLSHGAKLVYGRLSQWCNESGHSHRSAPQLSEELGMCVRSIKEYQKELRDVCLIGTYQPQAGGMNHFEFYDHPWMHEPINENLVYKQDTYIPVHDRALPRAELCTTPVHDRAPINNKEIKEIKCVGADATHTQSDQQKNKKQLAEEKALSAPEIQELFKTKFSGINITLEELFNSCQEHFEQKSLWATRDRFLKWVKDERIENYKKKPSQSASKLKIPTEDDFRKHEANEIGFEWVAVFIQSMYQLDRLPTQEFYQMGEAKARGYKWVKDWMNAKGLSKKQK